MCTWLEVIWWSRVQHLPSCIWFSHSSDYHGHHLHCQIHSIEDGKYFPIMVGILFPYLLYVWINNKLNLRKNLKFQAVRNIKCAEVARGSMRRNQRSFKMVIHSFILYENLDRALSKVYIFSLDNHSPCDFPHLLDTLCNAVLCGCPGFGWKCTCRINGVATLFCKGNSDILINRSWISV